MNKKITISVFGTKLIHDWKKLNNENQGGFHAVTTCIGTEPHNVVS